MTDNAVYPPLDNSSAKLLARDIMRTHPGWYATPVLVPAKLALEGVRTYLVKCYRYKEPTTGIHYLKDEGDWDTLRSEYDGHSAGGSATATEGSHNNLSDVSSTASIGGGATA